MKKRIQKSIAILGAAVLTMGLAGCSSSSNTPASSAPAADTAEAPAADVQAESAADTQAAEAAAGLSGSITLAGSTSMEKFANALAEAFMEKYPDVTVQAEFTDRKSVV